MSHGLSKTPAKVRVLTQMGETSSCFRGWHQYALPSGLVNDYLLYEHSSTVYTYDDSDVHLLGPDAQTYWSYGRVVGKGTGWGVGSSCMQQSGLARVQAWAEDAVAPDFETDWFEMQSGTGCSTSLRSRNVQEVAHGLGQRPDYVEVWVRVPESTPTYGGLMFKATGAVSAHSLHSSGTLTAWSSTVVRVWMSCQY